MKEGATFINTARGAVVRELEMIEVLSVRPDLLQSWMSQIPNLPSRARRRHPPQCHLDPHIAGSMEGECRRMGRYMIDECRR